jgi:hypothetical protein
MTQCLHFTALLFGRVYTHNHVALARFISARYIPTVVQDLKQAAQEFQRNTEKRKLLREAEEGERYVVPDNTSEVLALKSFYLESFIPR